LPRALTVDAPQPTRGVPGDWRDLWERDDRAELAEARERAAQFDAVVKRTATIWQAEIKAEQAVAKRWASVRPAV
jgi:hypothetical protein